MVFSKALHRVILDISRRCWSSVCWHVDVTSLMNELIHEGCSELIL